MMDLALKAKQLPVSSAAMMPPLIDTGSPDFTLIRQTVEKRIATSEAIDRPGPEPTPAANVSATPKPKPKPSASPNAQTDDLGEVCSA